MALACLTIAGVAVAQNREQKVRNDRRKVEGEGFWIYNDLTRGMAEAKKSGKPLLVVFRCIPCEECVKLDDDLVDKNVVVRPLLERFVCVRVVSANGLDLSLFQFDTDQSFAVFALNADGTIYGRFGTRSHRTVWEDDVSIEGLAEMLSGALALHADYPRNRAALERKKGPPPEFAVPELFPLLKGKYKSRLDYEGNVVRSCIHCHQIGDAQRQAWRDREERFPEALLYPYPHPRAVGLVMDPKERATVKQVEADSPAASAGFKSGDAIVAMEGQPLLSIADIQWVLHRAAPEGDELEAVIRREGSEIPLSLKLAKGWRRQDDLSWRVSTWELRRMVAGGLYLREATPEERQSLDLPAETMALYVIHAGEYPPHDTALKAGIRKGDVLTSFDERSDLVRESDLIAYGLTECRPGKRVKVTARRGEQTLKVELPIQ
jgi:hypothetical protein